MLVGQAKAVARRWVEEASGGIPRFAGAFFHGSVNWLAGDAWLPATSDLDVMVVLEDGEPARRPGKFVHREVLLEVSYHPRSSSARRRRCWGSTSWPAAFARPA